MRGVPRADDRRVLNGIFWRLRTGALWAIPLHGSLARRPDRQRNAVERFFGKLKHFRAVATRYDKRDDTFLASIQPASIRIWLRTYESGT